jgi:hypothetical protein
MARIYTGSYTAPQILFNPTVDNPATVTSTGTISVLSFNPGYIALYGSAGYAWTVANEGTVRSIGNDGTGIELASGGLVTNGASGGTLGLIAGSGVGIAIGGAAGTIVNYGTVEAIPSPIFPGNGVAIELVAIPGTVVNAGAVISHSYGGSAIGVAIGAGGSVVNAGTITAGATCGNATGINVSHTATIVNSGAVIAAYGSHTYGIFGSGAEISNSGTIVAAGTNGVGIDGGSVANSGLIAAAYGAESVQLINLGTIVATGNPDGFAVSGNVTNSGTITALSAKYGVAVSGPLLNGATGVVIAYHWAADGPVVNYGFIQSTQTASFSASLNGRAFAIHTAVSTGPTYVVNVGTIVAAGADQNSAGIYAYGGGVITNSGLITAPVQPIDLRKNFPHQTSNLPGTVVNFGTIAETGTADSAAGVMVATTGPQPYSPASEVFNTGTITAAASAGAAIRMG